MSKTGSKKDKKTKKSDELAQKPKKAAKPAAKSAADNKPVSEPEAPKRAALSPASDAEIAKIFEDPEQLTHYMTQVSKRGHEILRSYLETTPTKTLKMVEEPTDPLDVSGALSTIYSGYASEPEKLLKMQFGMWEDYAKLYNAMGKKAMGEKADPVIAPGPGDRRFSHQAWEENQMLDFIKQSYLIMAQWMRRSIAEADHVDPDTKARALFHTEQYLSAIAPTNFPSTNPEVIEETIRTQGDNLARGFKNLLEDLERGHGELSMRQADLDYFEVGRNIATTPGKVVFQNEIFQLIQYTPTTEEVAQRPLLIFPPWINKFYILDLQAENSLIRWMVEQGRTVFVVSWVNPGPSLKNMTFTDYMHKGIFEALDAVQLATGEKQADTVGYCIGGTLLATALGYMAAKGDERIASATFFTGQMDFSEAGELLYFIDDRQLANIEKQIEAAGGFLPGTSMARTFNMLRPQDLIWAVYIDNYLKGKEPKKFDLLYWNSDTTNQPRNVHLYYLKTFYRDNLLSKGKLMIDDVRVDLSKVKIPIYMQAGETDHIAPYRSVYNSAKLWGGDVTYLLAGSGHIAGVINPPSKNKYHYSVNPELPEKVDHWIAAAKKHPGSWWPHWLHWLDSQSEGKVPARMPGDAKLKVLESAPGSYVKTRS